MIKKEFLADFKINSVESTQDLYKICDEIRAKILQTVSSNGGHLSSSLGAVEIIVAMHHVFDSEINPFIFDVSHQAYAHKLLTGRYDRFDTLRQFKGISGFCNPKESKHDYFIAGHSSTSISLGVGVAKANELKNKADARPVVLIGDGALSAGLAFEGLDELGDREYPMIIILNDNEMSISKPIGALSNAISQALTHRHYQGFRGWLKDYLAKRPMIFGYLAKRFEESLKLITPGGILFEELGLKYIGPIDGHNLDMLISTFNRAKELKLPVIIHVKTTKGKGYTMAEGRFEKWHGVGAFDLDTGKSKSVKSSISPTEVFSQSLLALAKKDKKIVGITAAMPSGTGIDKLIEEMPSRFWDVAIAEQHGVTSMCALAKEGFKPFIAIYSTFLQRAYDEIVHDAGILSIPLKFAIDRAGIVGEDGETHQGLLDIAYLRSIPNMILFAPRDNATLKDSVKFAAGISTNPCAFRYPRGEFALKDGVFAPTPFALGKIEILCKGSGDIALIGYGNGVGRAYDVRNELLKDDIQSALVDLRFVKPLDKASLKRLFAKYKKIFVFSDSYFLGGVGSALLEFISSCDIKDVSLKSFEIKDEFITHGKTKLVEKSLGLDILSLVKSIKNSL